MNISLQEQFFGHTNLFPIALSFLEFPDLINLRKVSTKVKEAASKEIIFKNFKKNNPIAFQDYPLADFKHSYKNQVEQSWRWEHNKPIYEGIYWKDKRCDILGCKTFYFGKEIFEYVNSVKEEDGMTVHFKSVESDVNFSFKLEGAKRISRMAANALHIIIKTDINIHIFDAETKECIQTIPHVEDFNEMQVLDDFQSNELFLLGVSGHQSKLLVWDLKTKKLLTTLNPAFCPGGNSFALIGTKLFITSAQNPFALLNGTISINYYDLTAENIQPTPLPYEDQNPGVIRSIITDKNKLIVVSQENWNNWKRVYLRIWDADHLDIYERQTFVDIERFGTEMSFFVRGNLLIYPTDGVSWFQSGVTMLRVWDIKKNKLLYALKYDMRIIGCRDIYVDENKIISNVIRDSKNKYLNEEGLFICDFSNRNPIYKEIKESKITKEPIKKKTIKERIYDIWMRFVNFLKKCLENCRTLKNRIIRNLTTA